MTQQGHPEQDTQITAVILEKNGKRTADGNNKPYYEFSMQPVGSDFSIMYRQFENLDKGTASGDLARAADVGDTVTFMSFLRPAKGGGNHHNIRQMVAAGAVAVGQADPDFDDAPTAPATITAPAVINAPDPDFDTPPVLVKNLQRGLQKEATRYIAGNSMNSISIERQVSMKAAIDLVGHKANLAIALVNSGIAQTLAADDDPLGIGVLNAYWEWVCENGIPGEAHSIAEWLEYDFQGED